jgi:hypothetical protein
VFLFLNPQTTFYKWWGGEVSNLRRLTPTDLQSVPFGHSGTSPGTTTLLEIISTEEPPPACAEAQIAWKKRTPEKDGATEGTRTPDLLITNQLLYQLSYGGGIPLGTPLPCLLVTKIQRVITKEGK